MAKKKVLLTGAAGRIGNACRKNWGDHFDLRLHVYTEDQKPDGEGEVIVGACEDFEIMKQATDGVDAVVHLAAIPGEDSFHNILQSNIVGIYNVLEASRLNGVKRIAFASTNHTTGAWELNGIQANPDMPPRADSFYGASKVYGEVLGRLYADKHGIEFVALRIGNVNDKDRPLNIRGIWMWISHRDIAELFRLAIDTEGIQFAIVYGGSDNQNSCLELSSARDILGFKPQDSVKDYLGELPPDVVAKHESTVWKVMDKGTGFNAKEECELKTWPEW